jgi:HK97 family phage major capsid protein
MAIQRVNMPYTALQSQLAGFRVMISEPGSGNNLTGMRYMGTVFEPKWTQTVEYYEHYETASGKATWPRLKQGSGSNQYGGVVVEWTAESADKSETEAQFDQLTVEAFEVSAYTELGRTLTNRSAIDLPGLLTKLFRPAVMNAIDMAIISGSGVGRPKGILTASIQSANRATASQVNYADLVDLETKIAPQLRANCVFSMNDGALQYLKKKVDSTGRLIFVESPNKSMPGTLLGYPVLVNRRQPALGSTGDVIFGDLSQYITAVEEEVVIASSEHYKFRSGVTSFVVYALVGGDVAQTDAFVQLV